MMQKDEGRWREYKSDEKNNREGEKERDTFLESRASERKETRETWVSGPRVE